MIRMILSRIENSNDDIICHQVNCMGKMGAGVAKALYTKWPEVKHEYLALFNSDKPEDIRKRGEGLFGSIQFIQLRTPARGKHMRFCCNMFTQFYYKGHPDSPDGEVCFTNYEKFKGAVESVKDFAKLQGYKSIAMPYKIGCGLAGGDWNKVYKILQDVFAYDKDITLNLYQSRVYEFRKEKE